MTRVRTEGGAAALLSVVMAGVLVVVGGALAVLAAVVVDHRNAQAGADLAALAAASTLTRGGDACDAAARVAVANGARLASCEVVGSAVLVAVSVRGPHWRHLVADLEARARAGPG